MSSGSVSSICMAMIFSFDAARVRARSVVMGNVLDAFRAAAVKAGEGSGHHSEARRTATGYNTVSHPEEGRWETKVIGGHWE